MKPGNEAVRMTSVHHFLYATRTLNRIPKVESTGAATCAQALCLHTQTTPSSPGHCAAFPGITRDMEITQVPKKNPLLLLDASNFLVSWTRILPSLFLTLVFCLPSRAGTAIQIIQVQASIKKQWSSGFFRRLSAGRPRFSLWLVFHQY